MKKLHSRIILFSIVLLCVYPSCFSGKKKHRYNNHHAPTYQQKQNMYQPIKNKKQSIDDKATIDEPQNNIVSYTERVLNTLNNYQDQKFNEGEFQNWLTLAYHEIALQNDIEQFNNFWATVSPTIVLNHIPVHDVVQKKEIINSAYNVIIAEKATEHIEHTLNWAIANNAQADEPYVSELNKLLEENNKKTLIDFNNTSIDLIHKYLTSENRIKNKTQNDINTTTESIQNYITMMQDRINQIRNSSETKINNAKYTTQEKINSYMRDIFVILGATKNLQNKNMQQTNGEEDATDFYHLIDPQVQDFIKEYINSDQLFQ